MNLQSYVMRRAVHIGQCLVFVWNLKSELSLLKQLYCQISLAVLLVPSPSFPVMPHSQSKLFKDIIYLLHIK